MKRYIKIATALYIGLVVVGGFTPLAAQQATPLQQQDKNVDCTTQACIDTLQSAPGLQSQSSQNPLQQAPGTSPQSGVPLQASNNGLDVLGGESFAPKDNFDAGMLWISVVFLLLGAAALFVLVRLYNQGRAQAPVASEPQPAPQDAESNAKKSE